MQPWARMSRGPSSNPSPRLKPKPKAQTQAQGSKPSPTFESKPSPKRRWVCIHIVEESNLLSGSYWSALGFKLCWATCTVLNRSRRLLFLNCCSRHRSSSLGLSLHQFWVKYSYKPEFLIKIWWHMGTNMLIWAWARYYNFGKWISVTCMHSHPRYRAVSGLYRQTSLLPLITTKEMSQSWL